MSLFLLELTLEMSTYIFLTDDNRGCDNETHQRGQQHEPPVNVESFSHPVGNAEPDGTASKVANDANNPSANDNSIVILFHFIFLLCFYSRKCHCGVTFLDLITIIIYKYHRRLLRFIAKYKDRANLALSLFILLFEYIDTAIDNLYTIRM